MAPEGRPALVGPFRLPRDLSSPYLPGVADPATDYIGFASDPMKFMEFLAWYPFAFRHDLDPLFNTYVNLPRGSNMMWDTTVPFLAVMFWPVTVTFGVIASWKVALSTMLVLDGYCTFLLLRRHVHKAFAAWVGGLMMVVGPYAFTRAHGHLNVLAFFPVPLLVLEVEKLFAGSLVDNASSHRGKAACDRLSNAGRTRPSSSWPFTLRG